MDLSPFLYVLPAELSPFRHLLKQVRAWGLRWGSGPCEVRHHLPPGRVESSASPLHS